ncbi:MAG: hypothetical protein ABII27_02390 [bacterium]
MKLNIIIIFLLIIFVSVKEAFSADKRQITWENDLSIGWVTHNLEKDWHVMKDGINKAFNYQTGISTANPSDWKSEFEQKYEFALGVVPFKGFYGEVAYEFLGNYADRYWRPINDQHRMEMDSVKTKWTRGTARYHADWFKLDVFRGIGHSGWEYDGDMFGLFLEQYELERYRNISGSVLPRGGRVNVDLPYGNLDVVAGNELVWGYGPSIYTKYDFSLGNFKNTVFYKSEEINYGDPDEKLDATEFVTQFPVTRKVKVALGVLYQPFRTGDPYVQVEEVGSGAGIQGTKYVFHNKEAKTYHSWAESVNIQFKADPILDELRTQFTHAGLLAGNKDEVQVGAKKKVSYYSGSVLYTYRNPVEGPVPLIYEGTPDNQGNILAAPRDRYSAVRVDRDNRKAHIVEFVFNYDLTPGSWFYRWKPDTVDYWNINPGEDAPFATALKLKFEDYPESTDRNYYYDESGKVVFEPALLTGLPPTKRFIPSVNMISVLNFKPHKLTVELGGGESLATTVLAEDNDRPVTNYFKGRLIHEIGNLETSISYARDYWGPEDWHRDFGIIIDRLYMFGLTYKIHSETELFCSYIVPRIFDNKANTTDVGSFNELNFGMNIHFGANLLYEESRIAARKSEEKIQKRIPKIGFSFLASSFSPDGDGVNDELEIYLDVFSGIVQDWKVVILDKNNRVVSIFQDRGMPPEVLTWDGVDIEYGQTLAEGDYSIYFQVTDYYNHSVIADHMDVKIAYPY